MGIASYLVLQSGKELWLVRGGAGIWLQLLVNFFFWNGGDWFSFFWLVLPGLLWVAFAGYLNFAIALLH